MQPRATVQTLADQVAAQAIFLTHLSHLRQVRFQRDFGGFLHEIRQAKEHAQRQIDQVPS
ncbi:hypothetical protein PS838_06187 [Pseudomonas fluorescens]|nr:hypothetical protein PS838_06187 [Pseudomonas fluorescens]